MNWQSSSRKCPTRSRATYVALLGSALGSGTATGAGGTGFASAFTGFERRGVIAPAADFGALDRLLAVAGAGADTGASGQLIAQLLGHTS